MISFKIVEIRPKILSNMSHRQRNSVTELTLFPKNFKPKQITGCSICTVANYCSIECQERDQEIHEMECKLYGKCLPVFDAVRMMIRLIYKLSKQNGWEDFDLVFEDLGQGKCHMKKRYFSHLLR